MSSRTTCYANGSGKLCVQKHYTQNLELSQTDLVNLCLIQISGTRFPVRTGQCDALVGLGQIQLVTEVVMKIHNLFRSLADGLRMALVVPLALQRVQPFQFIFFGEGTNERRKVIAIPPAILLFVVVVEQYVEKKVVCETCYASIANTNKQC